MNTLDLAGAGLGSVIGVILALTGAGGAILAIPLLVFLLRLSVVQAAPVSLLAVGLSSAVGAAIGLREGSVRYKAAGMIALAGSVISPLGVWLSHRVPNAPLMLAFSCVLGLVSLRMLRQARASSGAREESAHPRPAAPCLRNPSTGRLRWNSRCAAALAGAGVVSGFLSGLLGVGGGFVIVPSLRKATDLPIKTIVATSLAVITLVSISGIASAAASGQVMWSLAIAFSLGAVAGMLVGRVLARRLPGPIVQQAFAWVAGVAAVGLAFKAIIGH